MVDLSDIIWLAGFMDGEGSFGLYGRHNTYYARIIVGNTSAFTIVRIRDMYKEMGITAYFYVDEGRRGYGNKVLYFLTVKERKSVLKLAGALVDYLYTKKMQALLILRWFELQPKNSKLTAEGKKIALEIRLANH